MGPVDGHMGVFEGVQVDDLINRYGGSKKRSRPGPTYTHLPSSRKGLWASKQTAAPREKKPMEDENYFPQK